eukprot:CAMPEP_0196656406 /NCGR_PEP_ID=MMETSP1086-20130531/16758_1 /TAXON_ID=77921 /ORGANISM="Cyanoptyche  gloeocystis , Strain SAG4.97" /LENGTH=79 /DNA_ID=CAMNT_0041989143 /DNA_START=271 /DNA_END=510 /DNA_ORIENTATION=-
MLESELHVGHDGGGCLKAIGCLNSPPSPLGALGPACARPEGSARQACQPAPAVSFRSSPAPAAPASLWSRRHLPGSQTP